MKYAAFDIILKSQKREEAIELTVLIYKYCLKLCILSEFDPLNSIARKCLILYIIESNLKDIIAIIQIFLNHLFIVPIKSDGSPEYLYVLFNILNKSLELSMITENYNFILSVD